MIIALLFALTLATNPTFCEHVPDWWFKVVFMQYEYQITQKDLQVALYYLESIHAVWVYQASYNCQ